MKMRSRLSDKSAKRLTILFLFLTAAVVAVALLFHRAQSCYEVTTFSMGSFVQQSIYGAERETAAQTAANEAARLEDLISWRIEESEINQLNQDAGGGFTEIDPRIYALLEMTKEVAQKSGGAFDPTISALSRLWAFDEEKALVPDADLIQDMLGYVDHSVLLLDSGTAAIKRSGFALDLGAIGKGAACDAMAAVYEQMDISGAVAAVGGSVVTYGSKPFQEQWRIAVRDPQGEGAIGEIAVSGTAFISTSGSYEKSFEKDGILYHHLLDPKTGYPAESGLVSVTVMAESGALSDALSTACFVLGYQEGAKLLASFQERVNGAVFVTEGMEVYATGSMKTSFTLYDEAYMQMDGTERP